MFNPADSRATRAMVEYRQDQLKRDITHATAHAEKSQPRRRFGRRVSTRRTIGFALIRLGNRLAGTTITPQLDLQL